MTNKHGIAIQAGLQFGPNKTGKLYLSVFYHRGNGRIKYKNKWHPTIHPSTEYHIFCKADYRNWSDSHGHYWGVHDGGVIILGIRGEILCKFPHNANPTTPWHGFPVSPMENGDCDAPPFEFVEDWIRNGVVSKTLGRRIQRRKV